MNTPKATTSETIRATLESIARTHFHQLSARREPFTTRNSDESDFFETAVWAIEAALEEAWSCGWADAEAHHGIEPVPFGRQLAQSASQPGVVRSAGSVAMDARVDAHQAAGTTLRIALLGHGPGHGGSP